MKKIIRLIRSQFVINRIGSYFLVFFKKLLDRIINYWPISGSRIYHLVNTSLALDANADDGFVNRLFYNKGYDDKVLSVFKSFVTTGSNVIYDIGANIGIFSLLAAKVNNTNSIYAFEPNPVNFKRLKSNISLNNFKNIHTFKMAIGNESKTIKLIKPKGQYISDVTSIYGSHTKRFTDFEHETFEVNEVSLDELFKDKKIKPPTIIKLDVELFEHQVLIGAKQIVSKNRPVILCELHNYDIVIGINENLKNELPFNFTQKIGEFFKELDYSAYAIGEFGLLKTTHLEECSNVKNFLFLPYQPKNVFYKYTEISQLLKK